MVWGIWKFTLLKLFGKSIGSLQYALPNYENMIAHAIV